MNPLAEAPPLYAAHSPQRCVEKELRVGGLKDVGVGLTLSEPVCSLSSGREMLASETALPTEPHSLESQTKEKAASPHSKHTPLPQDREGQCHGPSDTGCRNE